jgi:hypothetical protein
MMIRLSHIYSYHFCAANQRRKAVLDDMTVVSGHGMENA